MTATSCVSVGLIVADAVCDPVSRLPDAGQLELTPRISLAIGGCAANVAVDLVKLGVGTSLVAGVGNDPFGDFLRGTLSSSGVDVKHLATVAEPTSATLIVNVRGQDRRFIHAAGANTIIDGSQVSDELLRSARLLYVGGFCLMPNLTGSRLAALFQRARSLGVKTVLDVVVPNPLSPVWIDHLREVLPLTDVFLPNGDESLVLTGLKDPVEQAEQFRAWGVGTAVVTCGPDGAVLMDAKTRLRSAAFPVEFIDGTGSGDAFVAGYVEGLLRGLAPDQCLVQGSALGASCVRQSGATTGVFRRKELDEFLQNHSLRVEPLR